MVDKKFKHYFEMKSFSSTFAATVSEKEILNALIGLGVEARLIEAFLFYGLSLFRDVYSTIVSSIAEHKVIVLLNRQEGLSPDLLPVTSRNLYIRKPQLRQGQQGLFSMGVGGRLAFAGLLTSRFLTQQDRTLNHYQL